MTPNRPPLDGILLIDKPAGLTSAGVVREVKRRLGGRKVGHLGTLDPFATGLLPLAVGEGAKIVPFLNQEEKAYRGTIALGRATDTLDLTGRTTETGPVPTISSALLDEVTRQFCGQIEQVPPKFSALKRAGVPLYELARRGIEVDVEPRTVCIESLSLAAASEESLDVSVRCSKGTYVRSLARDIARALGTVGHLASLRRVAFGPFEIEQASSVEDVWLGAPLSLLTPRQALVGVRELDADERLAEQVRRGQQGGLAALAFPAGPEEIAKLIGPEGDLVAVLGASGQRWKILRVLAMSS
jgi:tRNA pseudouridine55 synthase